MNLSDFDLAVVLVMLASGAAFATAAALALGWAFRTGQFENTQRDAESIFDADEPIGHVTDETFRTSESAEDDHNQAVDNESSQHP